MGKRMELGTVRRRGVHRRRGHKGFDRDASASEVDMGRRAVQVYGAET